MQSLHAEAGLGSVLNSEILLHLGGPACSYDTGDPLRIFLMILLPSLHSPHKLGNAADAMQLVPF